MCQCEEDVPTVLSVNTSHTRTPAHAHTCNLVDFSSLRGAPCLLNRSDDATASCWAQMLPSVEAARATWLQMCTRTWEAHEGTSENGKQKTQASSKGPLYRLNAGLRNLMMKAASDIVSSLPVCAASSGLVLIHSQVCAFPLQSSVLLCLFQFSPFCLAVINKTCLRSGECVPGCSRGGVCFCV